MFGSPSDLLVFEQSGRMSVMDSESFFHTKVISAGEVEAALQVRVRLLPLSVFWVLGPVKVNQ